MRNSKLTQYRSWRLWPVHLVAKAFGVLVHVEGFPFGSSRIALASRRGDALSDGAGPTDSRSR